MPRLSLCLIARDEARFLPDCLASVAGTVDEIVVADTGSQDHTADIAAAAGARVVHHAWADDFAAARNAALDASTGDWILVLDADERLAPGAGTAIREAISAGGFHCGLLPLHNANALDASAREILSGAARIGEPVALPRLLQRDDALRWWGAIHETVGPWVASGRTARMVDAPLIHLGAVPSLRDARDKGTRNRALLERHLTRQPDDAWARAYLAWELLDAGHLDRATRQAARAWTDALAARDGADPLGRARDLSQAATLRAFTQLQTDDPAGALSTLDEAVRRGVDHPNLAMLRGAALDGIPAPEPEAVDRAITALAAARSEHGRVLPTTPIPGATSWGAATFEAGLRLRRGEHDAVLPLLDEALSSRPEHRQAIVLRAEALIANGAGTAALTELESLLGTDDTPDAWTVAARAAHAVDDPATAAACISRARNAEKHGWAALRRRASLARLEETIRARQALERLIGGRPAPSPDPDATLAAGADALASGDPGTAITRAAAALAAAPGNATAWTILGAALREAGLAPQAETAVRTALALAPDTALARRVLAGLLIDRQDRSTAARHLRAARDSEALASLGVHREGTGHATDLDVLTSAEDPRLLEGLLDALALQDPSAGAFRVLVIGPAAVSEACAAPRPFPVQRLPDLPTAVAGLREGVVVLLGADRRPGPGLLGQHRAAHAGPQRVMVGAGGVAPLDAPSELDVVLDAHEAHPPPGGWHDDPGSHASLPANLLKAIPSDRWDGGGLRQLPGLLSESGYRPVFLAACRAPRCRAPELATLRAAARARSRESAEPRARGRSVEAMKATLAKRTEVDGARAGIRRAAAALSRAACRRGRPEGEALSARVKALKQVLEWDRIEAAALVSTGRAEHPTPLIDRLTSVVMLNLNGDGHLYGAVESLRRHSPGPIELIVVDNGSTDASLPWLRAQRDIVVLEMGENIGAPAGRNRGLEVARGDTILFCDNDVVFTPGWRELLIEQLTAWPDVGAVGPMSDVVVGSQLVDAPPPQGADLDRWAQAFTRQNRGRSTWSGRLILFCMMFRRAAIEQIGGIDPRYGRWGFEDDDLSIRLARAGWHQRVAGDCFIQHLGSQTSRSANLDYDALLLENWERFKHRWGLDPDLPYRAPVSLDPILQRPWDASVDFVPFRREGWTPPSGPLRLLRWKR